MLKTSLALILIALQGFSALPARLHLCFEADGAFCCVDVGEHRCECDHSEACADDKAETHSCSGHSHCAADCQKPADEPSSTDKIGEPIHQHVVIAVASPEAVVKGNHNSQDEYSVLAVQVVPQLMQPVISTPNGDHHWLEDLEHLHATFSLFARASTVLRC